VNLDGEQVAYVERVGRFWEAGTGSRTAGRMLGWLMISEPAFQSSADLVEMLGVSAASVSTQIRQLEQLGFVERVTFPGDRARYYQLRERVWLRVMEEELNRIVELRKVAEAASNVMPASRQERVTELQTVAESLIDEWPGLMERMTLRLNEGPT
jgi:DNA-binding transcriptional regulator GbsR (MarR family)